MLNISGIHEGFVLDHIKAGMSLSIYHNLKLDKLDCTVAIIKNAKSNKMGKKDIIKVECPIDALDLDILGEKCNPLQEPTMHHFHRTGIRPNFPAHR